MSAVQVKQGNATLGRLRVGSAAPARDSVWQKIWRDRLMLLFIAPGVLFFVLFRYLPLLGNIIAFEDYLPFLGFFDSEFVGWANFQSMFSDAA
ncbi:MAG: sugar ABC transporter permease, partial [Chloroflexi bacterium]|nr:sugar ABC transporter permease [Chloroflexota bacterium]